MVYGGMRFEWDMGVAEMLQVGATEKRNLNFVLTEFNSETVRLYNWRDSGYCFTVPLNS